MASTRLPDIDDVPYLDVTAALDASKKTLSLFCVNRSLNVDIPADIAIRDFAGTANADVQTLRSASISDENDEDRPEACRACAESGTHLERPHAAHVSARERNRDYAAMRRKMRAIGSICA